MTKVLVTVKTYPNPSQKYQETVCTAGFLENGDWVRIYPLRMRMQKDYKDIFPKYRWINIDLEHYSKDPRPETRRPKNVDDVSAQPLEHISTRGDKYWQKRREIVLKKPPYTNMKDLITDAYDPNKGTSLAVFKPTQILSLKIEKAEAKIYSARKQMAVKQANMFDNPDTQVDELPIMPFIFKYEFLDDSGQKSKMTILDWELGALYWNSVRRRGNDEAKVLADVRNKYETEFFKKDVYLFLGTTLEHHRMNAPNPFTIVGIFYPPINLQQSLFDV